VHRLAPSPARRRFFLIPLVNAERAWAHAMELKALSRGENARKRHHAIKRLAKAASHAAQLASLAAARSDARTALEAEAYASWMVRAPMASCAPRWRRGAARALAFAPSRRVALTRARACCTRAAPGRQRAAGARDGLGRGADALRARASRVRAAR
jgi:hypothetical protein